ncbi:unnamed protein product [Lampetra fluviatilis]
MAADVTASLVPRPEWRSENSAVFVSRAMTRFESECSAAMHALEASSLWLRARAPAPPRVAIICGSGLGGIADRLQEPVAFDFADIPNFPSSTVAGHAGRLVFGRLGGQPTVCTQGRLHSYEGHPAWKVVFPVRVFHLLGVRILIVTNAAGAINPDYSVGDLVVIRDHVDLPGLAGNGALRGPNEPQLGPRFLCMSDAYDAALRSAALAAGKALGLGASLRRGTYAMVGGPGYETVAESRLLRSLGVDAVGMSTVPEVAAARHCGLRVLGLSLITNKAAMDYGRRDDDDDEEEGGEEGGGHRGGDEVERASHDEVLAVGEQRAATVESLVEAVLNLIT